MYLLMTTYRQDIMANFKLCVNVLVQSFHAKDQFHYNIVQKQY